MGLFANMYLNTSENIIALLLSFVWGVVLLDFMPLKQFSCSGNVGEDMDFSPVCSLCHFLSPQKLGQPQHPAAGSSTDELAMYKEPLPLSPSPPPVTLSISYLILLLEEAVKNGFWVTFCILLSFLIFLSSPQIIVIFFSKQFQLPQTTVFLWFFICSWSSSVQILFNKFEQPLNSAKLGFECVPIAWACKLRNMGVASFLFFIMFWESNA